MIGCTAGVCARALTLALLATAPTFAPSTTWALPRARLLREIAPGVANSDPEFAGVVNGALLFFATDDAHGRELWRSDGTVEGTQLVRDIRPGPLGSIGYGGAAVFGGKLAFAASDGEGGAQLWSSDGSEAGTVLVRDVLPGIANATVRLLTPDGPRLWFTAQSNFYDQNLRGSEQLWVSDLTTDGTRPLAEVGYWEPGFSGGTAAAVSVTPFLDSVVVSRKDTFECCERTSLTKLEADGITLNPLYQSDTYGHLYSPYPIIPFATADTVYFITRDSYGQFCHLWRSDGANLELIEESQAVCQLDALATRGTDLLLFRPGATLQLVRATPADTALLPVADLGEAFVEFAGSAVTPAGVYFSLRRIDGDELWRSVTATNPPTLVRRFERDDRSPRYLEYPTAAGDGVLFWIEERGADSSDYALWKSDGSPSGTRPIAVLPPNVSHGAVAEIGSAVLLAGYDSEHGGELWIVDRDPICAGDCNLDGSVDVAEVIASVDIALGLARLNVCPAADDNADLTVSIDELVASVHRALDGCADTLPQS